MKITHLKLIVMKGLMIIFCFVVGSLTGCNSSKKMPAVENIRWVLETLNGKEVELADPENEIFILFDLGEQRVNGRASCNRFFGSFEIDEKKLSFSPMGATRMACPYDGDWEKEFFQMLETVDSYTVKDHVLSFFSGEKTVAVFYGVAMDSETHNQ